jgi:hypothetical protein
MSTRNNRREGEGEVDRRKGTWEQEGVIRNVGELEGEGVETDGEMRSVFLSADHCNTQEVL